jgi:hypothetical protein
MSTSIPNRHAADELADTRDQIKQLETRESELRATLIADGADRRGDQYEALIETRDQNRLNLAAVVEHFGANALRPFYEKRGYVYVKLKRRPGT